MAPGRRGLQWLRLALPASLALGFAPGVGIMGSPEASSSSKGSRDSVSHASAASHQQLPLADAKGPRLSGESGANIEIPVLGGATADFPKDVMKGTFPASSVAHLPLSPPRDGNDQAAEPELAAAQGETDFHNSLVLEYSATARSLGTGGVIRTVRGLSFLAKLLKRLRAHQQLSRYEEEPGQRALARVVRNVQHDRWWKAGGIGKCIREILGHLCPTNTEQPVNLVSGTSQIPVFFHQILTANQHFVDMVVQEQATDKHWIGRMYLQSEGQEQAVDFLENDFVITQLAPAVEPVELFRHSLRFDIPIQLYQFLTTDPYVTAPDGQTFLNAVARRPLIKTRADQVMTKMPACGKGYKARLSLSQQAVRTVANLNCIERVHTNINPASFLVSEKGLVFLGNLYQSVPRGSVLSPTRLVAPGFTPPELANLPAWETAFAEPSQDAWQLGATLFTFWCEKVTSNASGASDFSGCNKKMPQQMKNLILAFTASDPAARLLPEEAAWQHPAMLLPIYHGDTSRYDTDQDDDEYI